MDQNIKLVVINLLKQRGAYSVSRNGIQHYTRCPFCGDSQNINHAHLSIHINVDDDSPILYRCLKCGESGVGTEKFLIEDLGLPMTEDDKSVLRKFTRKSLIRGHYTTTLPENVTIPNTDSSELTNKKLAYLNGRLGTNITEENASDYKIILDLYQFIKINHLIDPDTKKLTLDADLKTIKRLQENWIGFLSASNNNLIFRNCDNNSDWRWYKIKVNQKNLNPNGFYYIPFSFELMYTHTCDVHIAEGIFDILSIKENLIDKNLKNQFFFASCGFGIIPVLKFIVRSGMNTGIRLHIYSDNDKSDWDHRKNIYGKNGMVAWVDEVYIHRNKSIGEKDYGVTPDRIIDSKYILTGYKNG